MSFIKTLLAVFTLLFFAAIKPATASAHGNRGGGDSRYAVGMPYWQAQQQALAPDGEMYDEDGNHFIHWNTGAWTDDNGNIISPEYFAIYDVRIINGRRVLYRKGGNGHRSDRHGFESHGRQSSRSNHQNSQSGQRQNEAVRQGRQPQMQQRQPVQVPQRQMQSNGGQQGNQQDPRRKH